MTLFQTHLPTATVVEARGEITLTLPLADMLAGFQALRDILDFTQLIDLCVVDYQTYGQSEWVTDAATRTGFARGVQRLHAQPDAAPDSTFLTRYAVVTHLLSLSRNARVRVKVHAQGEPPRVPSLTLLWPNADWYEREAFDLYGVFFEGHPDLRRILTDYGFIGHPFRKDFPLIGQVEMRYDPAQQRVIYEPVSIEPRILVPRVIRADEER